MADLETITAAVACNSVGGAIAVTRIAHRHLPGSRRLAERANALLAETE